MPYRTTRDLTTGLGESMGSFIPKGTTAHFIRKEHERIVVRFDAKDVLTWKCNPQEPATPADHDKYLSVMPHCLEDENPE